MPLLGGLKHPDTHIHTQTRREDTFFYDEWGVGVKCSSDTLPPARAGTILLGGSGWVYPLRGEFLQRTAPERLGPRTPVGALR